VSNLRRRVACLLVVALTSIGLVAAPAAQALAQTAPWNPECPTTIHCVVVPAAFSANNGDVGDYGNYDDTHRPSDMGISKIVIHDTEGDLKSVLDLFQDSHAYVSCHYVIDTDGTVYQMVKTEDLPWHAGNWSFNMHSVCLEHIGHAAKGGTEYTDAMYHASAKLVKYLAAKFGIPRDRAHIIGHDNIPATSGAGISAMHNDPGPYWNWQKYMGYVAEFSTSSQQVFTAGSNFNLGVMIAPVWPLHKETVSGCTTAVVPPSCAPSGPQPSSFVYLRTMPQADAPLFTDPVLGQGTTDINNNAARLFWGQTFAVKSHKLERGGVWLQISVNGGTAWFYSPWNAPTAFPTLSGKYATTKGSTSVAAFGRAIPERSEYPPDLIAVPPGSWYVPTPAPLPYLVQPGQKYKVLDENPPTEHFYAWAIDSSSPFDHTMHYGAKKYVEIQLGGRSAFVPAAEVNLN
jgi:hypothetical protein